MSNVFVSIRSRGPQSSGRIIDLGDFHAVWRPGVTVGSDPGCTVVLAGLPPVAVRLVAASNHKMLYRLPEGTSLGELPPTRPLPPGGQRVDGGEFEVGPYQISFGERSTEDALDLRLLTLAVVDPRAFLAAWCGCLRALVSVSPSTESARQVLGAAEAWARGRGDIAPLREPREVSLRDAGALEGALSLVGYYGAMVAVSLADDQRRGAMGYLLSAPLSRLIEAHPAEQQAKLRADALALFEAQRWPVSAPPRDALLAASPVIAVAWDSVGSEASDQSVVELLSAYARAERLGLDWLDPVQRAVAERATDEGRLQTLLSSR